MIDRALSAHFFLHEFLRSETAARMGRAIEPTETEIENLRLLCAQVLEPIRVRLDRVITITSGLRPHWLNLEIRGSSTSEHPFGRAADFIVAGLRPIEVCREIAKMDLPFNQLIHEFGQWTHISVAAAGTVPKRQVRTASVINGATVYSIGIV